MLKDAQEIAKAFDVITYACENIKEHSACGYCPMKYLCLEDNTSVVEIADLASASLWDEFLTYADNVTFTDEDIVAQYADTARKISAEDKDRSEL